MQMRLVVVGMVLAGTADARPLPRGLEVVVNSGQALVPQRPITVPLRDDEILDVETISTVSGSACGTR